MRTVIADGDKRLKTGWIVTVSLVSIHQHLRATSQSDALLLLRSFEQCLTLVDIRITFDGELFATYTKERGLTMGIINQFNALNQTQFAKKEALAESGTAFFITDIRSAASKQTGNKVWYMDIVTVVTGDLLVLSQDSAPYRDPLIYGLASELGIDPDEKHTKLDTSYGPVRLVKKGRMYDLQDIEEESEDPTTLF